MFQKGFTMGCWLKVWLVVSLLCVPLAAQNISGSIAGDVADPSGLPLAGASVTLAQVTSGARFPATTNTQGSFEFLSLAPGTYDITVESSGFKKLSKTGLVLSANQRLSTGTLALEVGSVSESITVSGRVEAVQTVSSERGATINRRQIDALQTQGRDPTELIVLLPGVVGTGGYTASLQLPQALREYSVNGGRGNNKNFTIDGVAAMNTSTNQAASVTPNIDAVEEIQVQLSNYQAEFGRSSGPSINLITRSGTQQFHGSAYFYIRNEALNANDFFNNRRGVPKQRYRFRTEGFTLGGPVYIPKTFNTSRNKLFFFFAYSEQPVALPPALQQLTMPTALERRGDFSQTLDQQGRPITIRDPLSGGAAFAGNRIPQDRVNPLGTQLLNLFPLPNTADPLRRWNYEKTGIQYRQPRTEEILKLDYNLSQRFVLSGRYGQDSNDVITDYISNFSMTNTRLSRPGKNLSIRAVQTVSPRLVNELTVGYNRLHNDTIPESEKDLAAVERKSLGVELGQLNPKSNPDGLLPSIVFGAVPSGQNPPQIAEVFAEQLIRGFTVAENLSRIAGKHTMKFGLYFERTLTGDLTGNTQYAGRVNFSVDAVNPNDTGYPYANAVLGNFRSYEEVSARRRNEFQFTNVEWYAQDNWRLSRKLTLDYGMRFYWHQREFEVGDFMSGFDLARFDASKQVRLYEPFRHPQQGIVARDPLTGAIVPRTLTGAIVPGSGDLSNGLLLATDNSTPRGLMNNRGVHFAPRAGFAWDPFGKGDTAIRGGFGMFYDRPAGALIQAFATNPPAVITPTIYYGNLATLLGSSGVLFPQSVSGVTRDGKLPAVMNFSLGVQRRIGSLFLVDVAYVGSLARHMIEMRDYNTTPFGVNFKRENEDPTAPGRPLRATFLRPYRGYDAINIMEFTGNSSYHSLQAQVKRRFGRRINAEGVWTWSKAMTYADNDRANRSVLLPGWRDYGKAGFDATHTLNVIWTYDVPGLSNRLGPKWTRHVFDGWHLSGLSHFISGYPFPVTFSQVGGADFTGSTEPGRVNLIANPILPKDQRSFSRHFNTAAFALPRPGAFGVTRPADVDYGNAPRDVYRSPGINEWEATVQKDFHLFESERVDHRLEFRGEFYNVLNHPQFRRVNNNALFNAAGQQINAQFGEYTSGYSPRVIQLGLRYVF
jgi:hypothetical protein